MAFLRLWTRAEMRLRWRSLTVLAVLTALSAAVVLTAVTGARRGATAVDRLSEQTLPAHAFVLPLDPRFDWDRVSALPQVEAITRFTNSVGFTVDGVPGDDFLGGGVPIDDQQMRTIERPKVLQGRLPDPARPDEAVISPAFVAHYGLGVGDTLTARLLSGRQVQALFSGPPPARGEGPVQPIHIVGVVRSHWFADDGDFSARLFVSPGLAAAHPDLLVRGQALNALVRLRHGYRDLAAFRQEVSRVATQPGLTVRDMREFTTPRQHAAWFEAQALFAFGAAAGIAALVLIWQAAGRQAGLSARALTPLRPTGLTPRQVLLAAVLAPVAASTLGALVGTAGAIAASPWFPIGSARAFEPEPGLRTDPLVLVPGALLTVLVTAAAAALSAGWAARLAQGAVQLPVRRSRVAATAVRLGLPVPVQLGARYALESGTGRTALPARSALLAAVAGITGVMAAVVIAAGVQDGSTDRARYGVTFDLTQTVGFEREEADAAAASLSAAARDPGVRVVNDTRSSTAQAGPGHLPLPLFTVDGVDDAQPVELVITRGRAPDGRDEILLGPESARSLGATPGSVIELTAAGRRARLTVSGIGFTPNWIDSTYTQGGWVAPAAYRRLFTVSDYRFGLIGLRPGQDVAAARERLTAAVAALPGAELITIDPADPGMLPTNRVQSVARLRQLPVALSAFLAVLALGAAAHALATAVVRRRGELGVIRAVGATRWQVREVLATQASLLALTGLLFGLPLGIALGRTVWRLAAESVPLGYVSPPLIPGLLVLVPAALLLANLAAVVPGFRAVRSRPADVLRAE